MISELRINEELPGSAALQSALNQGWLVTHCVEDTAMIELLRRDLDWGESEAIALAVQLSATQILLDERDARQIARSLGLSITGVLGILLRGRQEGVIPSMQEVTDRLSQEANFHIAPLLLNQILQACGEL